MKATTTLILLLIMCLISPVQAQECTRIKPQTYSPTFSNYVQQDSCGWSSTFYASGVYTPFVGQLENCSSGGDSMGQAFIRVASRTGCPNGMNNVSSDWDSNDVAVGDFNEVAITATGPMTHNVIVEVQYEADCPSHPDGSTHIIWSVDHGCQN